MKKNRRKSPKKAKLEKELVLMTSPYLVVGFLVFALIAARNLGDPEKIEAISTAEVLKETPESFESEVFSFDEQGLPQFDLSLLSAEIDSAVMVNQNRQKINLTIDSNLQSEAKKILRKYELPWGAIVAMEPSTGRLLSIASHSEKEPYAEHLAIRSGFPAASLFKIITAAAAVEKKGLSPDKQIKYRGSDYILNKHNYQPSSKRDKRKMSFEKALSKSNNPVFARIALNHLDRGLLTHYAKQFGFNYSIPFDSNLESSSLEIEETDYSLARTAAGFGKAMISPLHAVSMMAAVANQGVMMKPHLIDNVKNSEGKVLYQSDPSILNRTILPSTADKLMHMLEGTTVYGTARKQFKRARTLKKQKIDVAAKTGTLSGKSPKGRYHWFVAAAPIENPEIAIAALVIDPGNAKLNGTGIGRLFLEKFFSKK